MLELGKVLYTAKVDYTGCQDTSVARSSDGRLDIALTPMDGEGQGTNPEQLLAASWSACFYSAIRLAARKRKVKLPGTMTIGAEVDLYVFAGVPTFQVRLNVSMPAVARFLARELLDEAHETCPLSLATRGNVGVVVKLT